MNPPRYYYYYYAVFKAPCVGRLDDKIADFAVFKVQTQPTGAQ